MIVKTKHLEQFTKDMEKLAKDEEMARLTNSPEPIYITNIVPKIINI